MEMIRSLFSQKKRDFEPLSLVSRLYASVTTSGLLMFSTALLTLSYTGSSLSCAGSTRFDKVTADLACSLTADLFQIGVDKIPTEKRTEYHRFLPLILFAFCLSLKIPLSIMKFFVSDKNLSHRAMMSNCSMWIKQMVWWRIILEFLYPTIVLGQWYISQWYFHTIITEVIHGNSNLFAEVMSCSLLIPGETGSLDHHQMICYSGLANPANIFFKILFSWFIILGLISLVNLLLLVSLLLSQTLRRITINWTTQGVKGDKEALKKAKDRFIMDFVQFIYLWIVKDNSSTQDFLKFIEAEIQPLVTTV